MRSEGTAYTKCFESNYCTYSIVPKTDFVVAREKGTTGLSSRTTKSGLLFLNLLQDCAIARDKDRGGCNTKLPSRVRRLLAFRHSIYQTFV